MINLPAYMITMFSPGKTMQSAIINFITKSIKKQYKP